MAKKLREEDLVLNIIVNGNKGQKEAAALGRTMRDAKIEVELLTAEQKKLERQGKKDTARYKELTQEISRNNAVIDSSRKKLTELGQSMKLVDQSTSQLRRTLNQLSRLKSQAIPGSAQYIEYDQQIKAINARLTELRINSQNTGNALQRMGSGFQRWLGVITAGIATFIGATMGVRKAIEEYARFDDKMADVQKTTNLTKEGVKALNAELEKIDTRTSQEDLLGLARIGGKLGLSDPEELRGFVSSSNQIIVALNEDLGGNVEETINTIGKLVSVFGVKEEFGIEQSILKVGSAINELGMASEANEGKIVDFTNRMAGIAPLAGISIEEILGLGATLDQFAQSPEVAGTALNKLFLNMAKDAKTYSKYAGMEVNAFKDLLEKDFMGAFKRVLVGVKGNSKGINELAATLGDLGVDGQRVIGVIGTLANQHEVLTEQIELSKKAFADGTSVTEEYNTKNETAAAKLDKARKEVTKFWRELGEKLWPTFTVGNNLLVTFLKLMGTLITFIAENIKWIGSLTLGIVSYTVATNAANIMTAIFNGVLKASIVVIRLWNAVLAINPLGALAVGLVAAYTALRHFTASVDAATAAQNALSESNKQAEKDSLSQTSAIKRNTGILQDETKTLDEKLIAIKNLRDIMPGVLQNYSDEAILAGKATKAIDQQTDAIILQARIRARQNKITEEESKLLDLQDQKERGFTGASFKERASTILENFFSKDYEKAYQETIDKNIEVSKAKVESLTDGILDAQGKLNKIHRDDPTAVTGTDDPVTVTASGTEDDKKRKEYEKLLQQQQDYQDAVILKTKSLLEQEEAEFQSRLKKAGLFGIEKEKMSAKQLEVLEALELEHSSNMQKINEKLKEENAKKQAEYRKVQMDGLDQIYLKDVQQQKEYYLEKLRLIDEMDISEQEKIIARDKLKAEYDLLDQEREREKLTARLLILEQSIAIGDLEIAEAKRVAEEIAKIKGELLSQEVKDAESAAKEKEKLEESSKQATKRIEDAIQSIYQSGAKVLAEIFKKNKVLSMSFLALEKAAAIAHVIINAQKEIAIHRVTAATMGPIAGPAYLAKQLMAAKMSAAASIATIAAQAISEAGRTGGPAGGSGNDNGSNGPSFTPRMSGREKGGFLVQRDQDGKHFNAAVDPSKRGYVQKPTVIVGENGSEFVASAKAVANPSVKAMLDIVDMAQRNGSISTINLEKILIGSGARRMKGYQGGGYIGSETASSSKYNNDKLDLDELNRNQKDLAKAMSLLNTVLQNGITAEVALLGKNGFVEKQKQLSKIEDNANL